MWISVLCRPALAVLHSGTLEASSSAVSRSDTGKGLERGLLRARPLVPNQLFSAGCLSNWGLCLNLTDKTKTCKDVNSWWQTVLSPWASAHGASRTVRTQYSPSCWKAAVQPTFFIVTQPFLLYLAFIAFLTLPAKRLNPPFSFFIHLSPWGDAVYPPPASSQVKPEWRALISTDRIQRPEMPFAEPP